MMSTAAKRSERSWTPIAIGTGFVLLAFCAVVIWHKHDHCQGWAGHYAARATQLRAEAANPALGAEQKREYLIAADWHDIISRKYAGVARQPWRPYPGDPLITLEEQRIVAVRH